MGKDKDRKEHTSEAFYFAILFLNNQHIERPLFSKALKVGKNFEREFPLNYIHIERKGYRKEIWKEIHSCNRKKTDMIKYCRAALVAFSKLLIPYALLRLKSIEYKPSIKFLEMKSRKSLQEQKTDKALLHCNCTYDRNVQQEITNLKNVIEIVYFPKTHLWLEKEIKWREAELKEKRNKLKIPHTINGILDLYDCFSWSVRDIDLKDIHPMTVEKMLNVYQEEFIDKMEFQYTDGQPPDLIFKAMIFAIFVSLWHSNNRRNKSADLTANLINEYCFYNSLTQSICHKINQKSVLNLWDNSKYNGKHLRGKTLKNILDDIFNFQSSIA